MTEMTKAEIRKRLGNITQLQELLFGEQIDEYNLKFEQYQQKLNQIEANHQRFQLVIDEKLAQLETRMLQNINAVANSLEKKIKYLNSSLHEKDQQLQQELETISQHNSENINFFHNSLSNSNKNLKEEIIQTQFSLERDMQLLKQKVFQKLEAHLSELSDNKVSRTDLAEVLFELCLKLKGTEADINHQLPEKLDNLNHNSHNIHNNGNNGARSTSN